MTSNNISKTIVFITMIINICCAKYIPETLVALNVSPYCKALHAFGGICGGVIGGLLIDIYTAYSTLICASLCVGISNILILHYSIPALYACRYFAVIWLYASTYVYTKLLYSDYIQFQRNMRYLYCTLFISAVFHPLCLLVTRNICLSDSFLLYCVSCVTCLSSVIFYTQGCMAELNQTSYSFKYIVNNISSIFKGIQWKYAFISGICLGHFYNNLKKLDVFYSSSEIIYLQTIGRLLVGYSIFNFRFDILKQEYLFILAILSTSYTKILSTIAFFAASCIQGAMQVQSKTRMLQADGPRGLSQASVSIVSCWMESIGNICPYWVESLIIISSTLF